MARRTCRLPTNCPANQADALAALIRFLGEARPVASAEQRGRPHRSQSAVRQVAQWLAENYHDPDALHGLHRRAHLSENYFREVFHRELGMNPRWYLTTLRMQAARFRLHERGMTVKEAAVAVGYPDPFHFSRLYRRFWGHPPSQDRRSRPGTEAPQR
jgi:AraC-like DNA-binding protein